HEFRSFQNTALAIESIRICSICWLAVRASVPDRSPLSRLAYISRTSAVRASTGDPDPPTVMPDDGSRAPKTPEALPLPRGSVAAGVAQRELDASAPRSTLHPGAATGDETLDLGERRHRRVARRRHRERAVRGAVLDGDRRVVAARQGVDQPGG